MKQWMRSWLAAVLFFLLIFLPDAAPARADSSLPAGFYSGWVSFSARKDETFSPSIPDESEDFFEIATYQGRGQVMVTINNAGQGVVSLVLPMATYMLSYAKISAQGGSCTTSASIGAKSNYVHLKDAPAAMGATFQSPYNQSAALYFTYEHQATFGDLGGCQNTGPVGLNAMKLRVPTDLSVVSTIQFQVNYQSDADMGGRCSLPGWARTYPYQGGQDTYTMQQCNWRAFKNSPANPKQGWK
jgi:hypothetical protein